MYDNEMKETMTRSAKHLCHFYARNATSNPLRIIFKPISFS